MQIVVATTAHDVADARLHRIVSTLQRTGADVEVHGVGSEADAPREARVHVRPRGGAWSRLVRAFRVLTFRADVLVVLDPELALVGLLWRALRRGALVVDVHEDYRAVARDRSWLAGPWRLVGVWAARIAATAASRADLTVVADEHVPPHEARRRLVVTNRPAVDELPRSDERDPTPRVVYVGDLRTSRGIDRLIGAVARTPPWELDLVGELRDPQLQNVLDTLPHGDRARIRLHGRLPLPAAWEVARGAWVGAALLRDTPAYRAAMPTKVYEYLAVGLPVLVSDLPRLADLVARARVGAVVRDEDEAVGRLRDWVANPAQLDTFRAAARLWAARELGSTTDFDRLAGAITALPVPHSRRSA